MLHVDFVFVECAYLFLEFWYACLIVNSDKMLIREIIS